MTVLRFYVQLAAGRIAGPLSDDELREGVRDGRYSDACRVRAGKAALWLPAQAWAALALSAPPLPPLPTAVDPEGRALSPDLLLAPGDVLDMIRFVVVEHEQVFGPLPGKVLRDGVEGGRYRNALVAPVGTSDWVGIRKLFDRTLTDRARATPTELAPELKKLRCLVCRELVPALAETCPECDEPMVAMAPSSRGSVPDDPIGASWIRMHWRPTLAFGAILGMIMTGITLRYLAPGRFYLDPYSAPMGKPAPPVTCEATCWSGEACQDGQCVWQRPNGVGHVASRPGIAGPFSLPADVSDAVLLDKERFAIGLLGGVELRSTRTGQALGLVSEAAQTRKLVPVDGAVYAVGPQHIGVLDGDDLHLLKTLELGAIVSDVTIGANGRRALVSLPGAHAIAILSTELHAELDRIRFGDDSIGPVAVDDTGKRALTTTGSVPLAGLPDQQGGAVYAFDPSRLATQQDRVRASMLGNPASVLMSPDGKTSYVVMRQAAKLTPVDWLPSGTIRQRPSTQTCDQPEELALLRAGRRGVIKCNRGRALQIFQLETGALLREIPFNAQVSDMVVTPDGAQIVVALPSARGSAIGLVDTASFEVEIVPLTEPPSRLRLSPSGDAVLAISDRSKVAWVIR